MKTVNESETSQEHKAFKGLLNRIMAVPRKELLRREAAYKKQSVLNPSKPGPKPNKQKTK
jgi:hypothetical protein